jgi:gas vesicle protein
MNEQGTPNTPGRSNAPLVGFVLGAAVGAGLALLLAPASGSETRRRIGETSHRWSSRLRNGVDQARGQLSGLKQDVAAAVASGRESFARERDARAPSLDPPRPL